jgi:hypothetical protein
MNAQERKQYIEIGWTGNGWLPIIRDLDSEMSKVDRNYTIEQIKEKFGGLRYYYYTSSPANRWYFSSFGVRRYNKRVEKMHALVRRATELCWTTCEECGSTENVSTKGKSWVKTLCDNCAQTE